MELKHNEELRSYRKLSDDGKIYDIRKEEVFKFIKEDLTKSRTSWDKLKYMLIKFAIHVAGVDNFKILISKGYRDWVNGKESAVERLAIDGAKLYYEKNGKFFFCFSYRGRFERGVEFSILQSSLKIEKSDLEIGLNNEAEVLKKLSPFLIEIKDNFFSLSNKKDKKEVELQEILEVIDNVISLF